MPKNSEKINPSQEEITSVIELYNSGDIAKTIDITKTLNNKYPNVPLFFNILGACYKSLNEFDSSVKMFKAAIAIKQDYIEAHKNLAVTLLDLGQFDEALVSLNNAITINPNFAEAHYHRANLLKDLGRAKEAIESYQKVIHLKPNFADAHNNLANIFESLEMYDEALVNYQNAIDLNSNFSEAFNNLANTLKILGRLDEALENYYKAIKINPNIAEVYNNIANTYKDLNQFDNALESYDKAISINPNFSEAFYNKGLVLKNLRRFDSAIEDLNKVISIKPDFAPAYNNLGSAYLALGQSKKAIEFCEKALSIDSNYAEAYNNFGNILKELRKSNAAKKYYEKAIEIKPDYAQAYVNLGSIFKDQKNQEKALQLYLKAFEINPKIDYILGDILGTKMSLCIWDDFSNHINELRKSIDNDQKTIVPFLLLSLIDEPIIQLKASKNFSKDYYPANNALGKVDSHKLHSKIRIGYFSADFKHHPVATLTAELYELHNRNEFEIHAFSFGPDTNDEMNLRIKKSVDYFHNVIDLSHVDIVKLSRFHEIDIAVDLGGYTSKSRTEIFAMSLAKIQLSYIGYLGTMGSSYYDYLIADKVIIPKENRKFFEEKIIYLPSFQVNDTKDVRPESFFSRKDLNLPEQGFIFCCFNNTYKINPACFDSWARILDNVEGSVLMIYVKNKLSKKNLAKEIKQRGVDPSRLIFANALPRPEYLARYRVVDLFLDTTPYNAGTTASDALRMGLPVLTLIGNSYQSRMAASILNSVGLPELITTSQKDYEFHAIELATKPEKLKNIKDKLENNIDKTLLFDSKKFTLNIEAAYKKVYARSVKRAKASDVIIKN